MHITAPTGLGADLKNAKLEVRASNFTQALIEGLAGKASKTEGAVYLHQLDTYITDRVKVLTKGAQHPVTAKPSTIRSFQMSKP